MEKRKRKNSCSDDEDTAAVIESQGRDKTVSSIMNHFHLFRGYKIFSGQKLHWKNSDEKNRL